MGVRICLIVFCLKKLIELFSAEIGSVITHKCPWKAHVIESLSDCCTSFVAWLKTFGNRWTSTHLANASIKRSIMWPFKWPISAWTRDWSSVGSFQEQIKKAQKIDSFLTYLRPWLVHLEMLPLQHLLHLLQGLIVHLLLWCGDQDVILIRSNVLDSFQELIHDFLENEGCS